MVSSTDIATEASHDVGISIEFRNVSFAYPDLRNEWEIRRAKQAKLEKKLTKKKDKAAAAAADSDDESDSDEEKVKWILKDVSFFVPAGQTVSIVGRNGCGKSTLIKLLTRIFDPAEGQILFNGIDIRKLKVEDLRSIVSVLEQSCKVMPGTIGHGISAGRIDSYAKMSREQRLSTVKHVAERCGFAKVLNDKSDHRGFDSFQGPYDYYNGGHIHFSGGEKQKLAIAKAIFRAGPDFITDNDETGEIGSDEDPLAGMKSARVIVFDEPAAALDAIADNEVQQELQRMVKTSDAVRAKAGMPVKRTALFISHRMSSSRTADRIIVLGDKGSVVEDGNHAELMKIPLEDSVYRKLFETQANSYTD
ncbi:P-loop containing nucleoside triphosphate hydrolase protein [Ramicandelaber brevisporus]|nr:P-loop containing nucleoside triphosphate hydrolase protein [Ramicandelaber brevisporus]